MYPLILTTYLVLRHKFRFKRNIERLYIEQQLSAREIAIKLDCSHNSINAALKKFNMPKSEKIRRPKYGRQTPNKSESQINKELKIITLIAKLKNQGKSLRMIAKYLNNKAVRTPSGDGLWVQSTIKRILNS